MREIGGEWGGIGGFADCGAGKGKLPDFLCVGRGERACVGWARNIWT